MRTSQAVVDLLPRARGPYELLRHAYEHLRKGDDTDRRIALIGFDNGIEVSIDVFLRLHPRLRNGYEISKEDQVKARQNHHMKIEFLDKYVQDKKLTLQYRLSRSSGTTNSATTNTIPATAWCRRNTYLMELRPQPC